MQMYQNINNHVDVHTLVSISIQTKNKYKYNFNNICHVQNICLYKQNTRLSKYNNTIKYKKI